MKKIEAIIRPTKLEELKDKLQKYDISGLTISQVLGCGQQKGYLTDMHSEEFLITFLPKIEIKMIVSDDKLEDILDIIASVAYTGEIGDGKIFISDICDCVRIRTSERGINAL